MASLPSGTVTFLFTDIEGSTSRAFELGDEAYAAALTTHRELLRDAFAAHSGVEVSSEGDAFFVAFARAGEATAAACAGQRALESHAWPPGSSLRVRMGLHTGEVLVREQDYVGHEVHRAKRICDVGHGGQILLSESTAALVAAHLPPGAALVNLGQHRLKDLGQPQRLFQLSMSDLPGRFPPLRSLESYANNLPAQRTSFVGREVQIAELTKLLAEHRLVTLTGVGGCGKTRLAVQVGAELVEQHPHGVFFVDLAAVADQDGVASAVASSVDVPMTADLGPDPQPAARLLLLAHLSQRRCLVILDNCEHLLEAVADLVDQMLARCPQVTLMATSREALEVEGEQSWRVPSLSVPVDVDPIGSESVQLFASRARAVRPDFQLSDRNADAVAEICRRLDGLPLAIEFAAARVAHMSPAEIAGRLGDMFSLLAGGPRRRVQRQQTLQATLDWSYELLTDAEQQLLRELGVFPATFDLTAAERVCTRGETSTLDLLASLVAKSLVTTVELPDRTTRYRLIEPVRAYAAGKLRESGHADNLRGRHRDWYTSWLRSIATEPLSQAKSAALLKEQANIRASLEWSEAEGRLDLVVTIALLADHFWPLIGSHREGFRWLTLARPEDLELPLDDQLRALAICAFLAQALQLPDANDFADRAIALGRGSNSPFMVRALSQRALGDAVSGLWAVDRARYQQARQRLDEALTLAGDKPNELVYVLSYIGFVEILWEQYAEAAASFRTALEHQPDAVNSGPGLMTALHILGQHEEAKQAAERFCRLRPVRSPHEASAAAAVAAGSGDIARAQAVLRAALEPALGFPTGLEIMAVGFAAVAFVAGDQQAASRLLGWVRARTLDAGRYLSSPTGFALYRHYVALVRAELDAETARRCRNEGRTMTDDEVLDFLRDTDVSRPPSS